MKKNRLNMGCSISKSVQVITDAHTPREKLVGKNSSDSIRSEACCEDSINNNRHTPTKNKDEEIDRAEYRIAPESECPKENDYVDIYRQKPIDRTWSLDDAIYVHKSMHSWDSKSITTAKTFETNYSAASARTKATYLEKEPNQNLYGSTNLFHDDEFGEVLEEERTYDLINESALSNVNRQLEVFEKVPVRPSAVYDGNHFWWPNKRVLLPDYQRLCAVDSMAIKVSFSPDLDKIVAQFGIFCEEEVEMARSIFRWIITHIKYKDAGKFQQVEETSTILKNQEASSFGISTLFLQMCSIANLECEIITGISKMGIYYPGMLEPEDICSPKNPMAHAWNKVKLGRRWFIVDASLIQTFCSKQEHSEDRTVGDEAFLPKPQDFLTVNLPMYESDGSLEIDLENQLVGDNVCADITDWEQNVPRSISAHAWNIKPLSHQFGQIDTDENEIWIQFMCPNIMDYHIHMYKVSGNAHKEQKGHSLIYLQEDIITAYLRFPGPDRYIVKLFACPIYIKSRASGLRCKLVMTYTVNATGKIYHSPFSKAMDGLWGVTPTLFDTGCRLLNSKGAEISSVDGTAVVDLWLPVPALFPNAVWFCKSCEEDINLDGFVYAEREGRTARIHLSFPQPGEYILEFSFPVENSYLFVQNTCSQQQHQIDDSYEDLNVHAYARFFITCHEIIGDIAPFPHFPTYLCGPQMSLVHHNLNLIDQRGSTLCTKEGECQFTIEQEGPLIITHEIQDQQGQIPCNSLRWIYAERDGYSITYHIKMPESGRYKLTLRACKCDWDNSDSDTDVSDIDGSDSVICVFMIDSPDCHSSDLYPAHSGIWGIMPKFHQLGLCSDLEEFSQLTVDNEGVSNLAVRAPPDVHLVPRLYHGNDSTMDLMEHRTSYLMETDVHFLVVLPYKGYYQLQLLQQDDILARYLIYCDKPAKNSFHFEPFWTYYGVYPSFSVNGLRDLAERIGPIREAMSGKCSINHDVPKGLRIRFSLLHKGMELKGCVYAEQNGSEVKYHINLPHKGYHRFTCWIITEAEETETLLFSYLLLNKEVGDFLMSNEHLYPDWPQIWGLNPEGYKLGVKIRGRQSSTIKANKGMANLAISQPEDIEIFGSLEDKEAETKQCIFMEHHSPVQKLIYISVPGAGKFSLKLWAKKNGWEHSVAIAAFLVVATEPGIHRYPDLGDLYPGCRVLEPLINPLSADNEYFFKLEIPGALRLQLWDGVGQWRALLESQDGSNIISGVVNVGGAKELWVAGMYDSEYEYGGGGFRNLLMYEVV